jgi:uncharacterized repeat protein (TIGR03803 family)
MMAVLTVLAMALAFVSGAWAKPKFRILQHVGGNLSGGLTLDAAGNVYGATCAGGPNEDGTIFELVKDQKWAISVLHTFDGSDGTCPNGGLIFDAESNVYGTTEQGGAYRGGEVFELSPGRGPNPTWTFSVLYSFCQEYGCPDGAPPDAGVTLDAQGNLYGTTGGGGANDGGVAYELTSTQDGWEYTVVHTFGVPSGHSDGANPGDAVVLDASGNLYGTTGRGGEYGLGTVFVLTYNSGQWTEDLLWQFSGKDGAGPVVPVTLDGKGNIYGTTAGGGDFCDGEFCGTAFELTPNSGGGWKRHQMHGFVKPQGGFYPSSGLTMNAGGDFYGTTAAGGTGACGNGCGVVYKLAPRAGGKWKYTVLHEFTGQYESPPTGQLALDAKGSLYGDAYFIVYEVIP